ncbi:calcium-translocating P-type ATPase, PMCA-type, variant 2 [Verruconis gallopava]|uniref:Calcium-transporting ATPase n=1 Tax=Verruconis gallopava TaxID=253628 RepID=A0A0D2A5I9_9PEZI|nr:calcium-translocating P-type ATPase, PMCA-type, variant 1 [Verruconis gallopava]XP_016211684.1 calcium-translocating P-type ATPase, PMCA-type, variant 2 [Verruconis gallopava]KIW01814.1 calcium-translocating P-type ATPase, PMCA-type, variant 1 [Verruconis gallopava]KIW01815.1 calcium-translocating P-type ATPase, PMCA-type, variant 2 [Verruconis gallopava]
MGDKDKPAALRRPRAPTITVDTSNVNEHHDIEVNSPSTFSGNTNTLAVPTGNRTRGGSVDSFSSAGASSQTYSEMGEEDVLAPREGEDETFNIEDNPFAFVPGQMSRLYNPKSLEAFKAVGGLGGLEYGLRTDIKTGLSPDEQKLDGKVTIEEARAKASDTTRKSAVKPAVSGGDDAITPTKVAKSAFEDRRRVFGENRLPEKKPKNILQLAWIALQDKILILLSVAAVVSLALGLYQTFAGTEPGAKVEWVEGVAIIVAIFIVVMVGAVNDWQKERQFMKLNKKKDDRLVKVIRSGKTMKVSVYECFVGDVMILEQGDVLPVDGIFIDGYNVSCDESSATGESDLMKKTPANEVWRAMQEGRSLKKMDPFILSGAKVAEGVGSFLVTAVGVHSSYGKTMMALREDNEVTPLQYKLNILAGYIAKLGSAAGLLLFTVTFIEFLARLPNNDKDAQGKAQEFLRLFITAVTIIVVAVPEGLPLAVTLALAFATKRMTKDNNLVRHLQSCETMGNATVICSDKTGTLTQNVMTVVVGTLGSGGFRFGDKNKVPEDANETTDEREPNLAASDESSPTGGEADPISPVSDIEGRPSTDSGKKRMSVASSQSPHVVVTMNEISNKLSPEMRDLFKQAIAINTTAFEGEENGKFAFVGTKTETALLDWAKLCLGLGTLSVERSNFPVVQLFPFDSKHKCMGVVVKVSDNTYRVFFKGAPEILLPQCNRILEDPSEKLSDVPIRDSHRNEIKAIQSHYASLSLRTIGFSYADYEQWPPAKASRLQDNPDLVEFSFAFREMIWMGIVGIQDPVRPSVPKAVQDCKRASVRVKMVTGDNVETAKAIARECDILPKDGLVMEGPEFRRLSETEMDAKVLDLCVLARSSPEDKRILVKALKRLHQVVAVTGDGTNDAPALKAADVGFSMGITGTEVAKEASDIILMDDNFASIVKALMWGRTINDAVKKFLQFQITVNITAVILTFVSAVANDEGQAVLNAVQLLWVNLIMDTFAALALATDPPAGSLLDRKPEPRNSSLISLTMWKMIIGQSIFQLVVTFILYFAGPGWFHYPARQQAALVFNVFVWMQIFNAVNARRIDNSFNIFEGFFKNWIFIVILLIMIGGQTLIIFVGGEAFVVTKLTGPQWGISIVLGFLSIPCGLLVRLIPDRWISKFIDKLIPEALRRRRVRVEDTEGGSYDLARALFDVRDDLAFLKRVRGGRINQLKHKIQHPKEILQRSRSGSRLSSSPMQSALGMPGLLAGSIAGLSPIERPIHSRDHSTLSPESAGEAKPREHV